MALQYPTISFALWSFFLRLILLYCLILLQPTDCIIANTLRNETDRFALLKLKESISNDPRSVLSSWNDSVHFCEWPGVTCSTRRQRVIALELEGYNMRGTVSPYIGNLSLLRFISLGSNSFFGEIPQQICRLFRLRYLNLSYNVFEGKIPVNLSYCSQLRILELAANRLSGTIPLELGSLAKLESLLLNKNNLTRGITPSLGNISSLTELSLAYNNLVGNIPNEIGKLKILEFIALVSNNLSGTIPPSFFNISSINTISFAVNHFHGILPSDIGFKLPNLQRFGIADNELSGKIPESLSNASLLQALDIPFNNFVGQVPTSLGGLRELRWLGLSRNNLGNYLPSSWDFMKSLSNCSMLEMLDLSMNNFVGVLPNAIANLSTSLAHLYLGGNFIHGNIPTTLQNLVNLVILGIDDNIFTGVIPTTSLGKLQSLQLLWLNKNRLSGKIPRSIGNFTKIVELYLSDNKLEGGIPSTIADCRNLQYLDISNNHLSGTIPQEIFGMSSLSVLLNLSHNSLEGSLPMEVGKLKNINGLDLSENNMTNEIPDAIGDCESLEFLYLQGNSITAAMPSALASLRGLQYLDLSRNNLSGQIPKEFEKLGGLWYLNLSFNDLEGEVPNKGVFQNTSAVSLVGNAKLCGGITKLQLPRCPIKDSNLENKTKRRKLTIILVCVIALFLPLSAFAIILWRRKSTTKLPPTLSKINFLSKVSYKMLYQATDGFSPSMLIGTGSFGSVYKGILVQEEEPVAIKVLNLHKKGALKSFVAECNALRNIRHRNLVKILTCCSSSDYNGNEFKALVFEYMSNGSLEKWLHHVTDYENRSRGLNLIQRLNIAIDVASAMYYLHEDCDQPIIHCDLKSGNVLLDAEMIAHVSDFGLARLLLTNTDFSDGQTNTIGIKGTIGYVAPEYAMGGVPSKQGDVYSYGILVLEMFSGRRPTDEMFKDDFKLHNFIKKALPERLAQIMDSSLLPNEVEGTAVRSEERNSGNNEGIEIDVEEGNINFENPNRISADLQKCLVSVLEIGVACSEESPNERMNMEDVVRKLHHIRNAYVGGGIH